MYQQTIFANQQLYHIVNRGVEKRTIFLDKRDHQRFLETMNYYKTKEPLARFSFRNRPSLQKKDKVKKDKVALPFVDIICFCLMPNHFHLLLRQREEGGITTLLSKLSNSYTKYFNTKHGRVGPLFQGSFKATRIEDNEQLLHVSRYIHLNPIIDYLVKDLKAYPYSSYLEFLGLRNGFCQKESILGHFAKVSDYEAFVLNQEDYGRTMKRMERLLLDD